MTTGPWAKMSASDRGKILRRISDLVIERTSHLAELEVRDNGKLLGDVKSGLKFSSDIWNYYAGLADKIEDAVMPIEKSNVNRPGFAGGCLG